MVLAARSWQGISRKSAWEMAAGRSPRFASNLGPARRIRRAIGEPGDQWKAPVFARLTGQGLTTAQLNAFKVTARNRGSPLPESVIQALAAIRLGALLAWTLPADTIKPPPGRHSWLPVITAFFYSRASSFAAVRRIRPAPRITWK